jgi:hypothetical protein
MDTPRRASPAHPQRSSNSLASPRALRAAVACVAVVACQSPAFVRTARTLPAGGNDISFSINLARVSLSETTIEGVPVPIQDFNLPNPVPELIYSHGITDDFELGGRVALGSGLFELNTKYRVLHAMDRRLHFALAPAAGYRVLALVNGAVLTLPAIVTFDSSSGVSFSGGPLVSYASYSMPDSLDAGDLNLSGDTVYVGAGLGVELRPVFGFHVMPAIEVHRSVSRRGDVENLPEIDMLFLGLTLGFGS